MPVAGKVAIVTGASGTIGGAISAALAKAGCRVVMTARRELGGATNLDFQKADVTDEKSVALLFEKVMEKYGQVDILVNSAGLTQSATVEDLDIEAFRKVLDVNVTGTMLCAKYAFRSKVKRIINVGSISSMAPRPQSAAYTASKFAVQGLTRALALDGRQKGISVSVVHPGNVRSDLLTPEELESRGQSEGFLDVHDLAQSVLHMASLPDNTNILELTVLPTTQPLVGRG